MVNDKRYERSKVTKQKPPEKSIVKHYPHGQFEQQFLVQAPIGCRLDTNCKCSTRPFDFKKAIN